MYNRMIIETDNVTGESFLSVSLKVIAKIMKQYGAKDYTGYVEFRDNSQFHFDEAPKIIGTGQDRKLVMRFYQSFKKDAEGYVAFPIELLVRHLPGHPLITPRAAFTKALETYDMKADEAVIDERWGEGYFLLIPLKKKSHEKE